MISRLANFVADFEGLGFVATLVLGIGLLGYLSASWLLHLARSGLYFGAFAVAALFLGAAILSALRIPAAQIVVLGSAIVCSTAFLLGYANVLLP